MEKRLFTGRLVLAALQVCDIVAGILGGPRAKFPEVLPWAQGLPTAELRMLPLFLCDSLMGLEATKPGKSVFILHVIVQLHGQGPQR